MGRYHQFSSRRRASDIDGAPPLSATQREQRRVRGNRIEPLVVERYLRPTAKGHFHLSLGSRSFQTDHRAYVAILSRGGSCEWPINLQFQRTRGVVVL